MRGTYRAILSSWPASMLKRLVFTDRAAGERCEWASRLLVLLFLGKATCCWRSGAETMWVRFGGDNGGGLLGEPGGVEMSVDGFMCALCAACVGRRVGWLSGEVRGSGSQCSQRAVASSNSGSPEGCGMEWNAHGTLPARPRKPFVTSRGTW